MARKIGKAYLLSRAKGDLLSSGNGGRLMQSSASDVFEASEYLERGEGGKFQAKNSGSDLITIEAVEHQHLLRLYYAVYDDSVAPTASTETNYLRALKQCNDFYAGDTALCQ